MRWPWQKHPESEPEQPEQRSSLENPAVGLGDADELSDITNVSAGQTVNRETALSVPAVWAAVNVLSSTIASLPLNLYQKDGENREKQSSSPIHQLIHSAPNRRWTSYRWRKHLMQSVLLDGRSYTWIDRPNSGVIRALWPLDPQAVTPKWDRATQRMKYEYRPNSEHDRPEHVYDEAEIIDIPWMLDLNGVDHIKPLNKLKRAVGLSIALEQYATTFFESGGVPPLQMTGPIKSGAAAQRASEEITQRLLRRRNKNVLVLPDGHELKQIGYNPEQSQLMDSRRFQIEEVARIYDLSPSFLQDLTRSTFSNEESKALHFVKHTVTQWITSIEQEINLKLFGAGSTRFVEFNVEGLLRGDFQTRMTGYATAIQNSINTPNEVRQKENLPDAEGGDDLVLQQNMVSLSRLGETTEPEPDTTGDNDE